MWFWWFMFCCDILIPLIMILAGRMMEKHPPKDINSAVGYRTNRSMKNQDTWQFAHHYCGRLWWRVGWILLIPSVVIPALFYGADDGTIGTVGVVLTVIQTIALILTIIPTEQALKRTFTDDGKRR